MKKEFFSTEGGLTVETGRAQSLQNANHPSLQNANQLNPELDSGENGKFLKNIRTNLKNIRTK